METTGTKLVCDIYRSGGHTKEATVHACRAKFLTFHPSPNGQLYVHDVQQVYQMISDPPQISSWISVIGEIHSRKCTFLSKVLKMVDEYPGPPAYTDIDLTMPNVPTYVCMFIVCWTAK
jgi:hypothetical protein